MVHPTSSEQFHEVIVKAMKVSSGSIIFTIRSTYAEPVISEKRRKDRHALMYIFMSSTNPSKLTKTRALMPPLRIHQNNKITKK